MKNINKKTKIICTIGPASHKRIIIEKQIKAGTNTFRLNFSHSTHEKHKEAILNIRKTAEKLETHVAILADLQGPKIRTGKTEFDQMITLKKGKKILITPAKTLCTDKIIYINYKSLLKEIRKGQYILINDGAVKLRINNINEKNAECYICNTGEYSSHKGVNFPNIDLKTPSLTLKDKKDLKFILNQDIDYIALSFVRRPKDLDYLVRAVKISGKSMKIIAKIEKPEASHSLPQILNKCDGIMVARGDLGIEMSPYKVPILQKRFIETANNMGKIVIVATQMLESMITNPIPTRAESTDVANAILDNTDAVMLSAESAIGAYPVKSVDTLTKIALETEKSRYYKISAADLQLKSCYAPHAVCEAAERASRDLNNAPVLVFTVSGDTALYLSKIRNHSPIFAFTPNYNVANTLSLAWNIFSFILPIKKNPHELFLSAELILYKKKLVKKNQQIIIICGTMPVKGATNLLRLKKVE
jgi:pyruvate kinase